MKTRQELNEEISNLETIANLYMESMTYAEKANEMAEAMGFIFCGVKAGEELEYMQAYMCRQISARYKQIDKLEEQE